MRKTVVLLGLLCFILTGCASQKAPAQVAATTLPVYEFSSRICAGTDITVTRLVTESVTCLHDYSLSVSQVRAVEGAEVVVLSGAGLEGFLADVVRDKATIDSSVGIKLLGCGHDHDHDHAHEQDAHIWLSPANAKQMVINICDGLKAKYPAYGSVFERNADGLLQEIDELEAYGKNQLSQLSGRELITFHDGFSYFAQSFDLTILEAIEEESGSEASAAELKELIDLTRAHQLKAVFTERNGSASAAQVLARETGVKVFALDMAMSGDSWYGAMIHNIKTVKEALG